MARWLLDAAGMISFGVSVLCFADHVYVAWFIFACLSGIFIFAANCILEDQIRKQIEAEYFEAEDDEYDEAVG